MFFSPFSGHLMGSLRIEIKAFLTYAAIAAAIAAVIENKDTDSPLVE